MPTHHRGPQAEIDALNAYIKLMRATESVTARIHEVLPRGLTITQFAVLETLFHLGPLCQSSLAGKLLKSTGNLTLVVDNLEKARFVQRERHADDRRFVTVNLTPKGRAHIETLFPKIAKRITHEFAALSSSEQATLARLCKKLGVGAHDASAKTRTAR
jgi:MarR family transcriptional regulator, 2-MHQ and catechol-resistance regulon repressor